MFHVATYYSQEPGWLVFYHPTLSSWTSGRYEYESIIGNAAAQTLKTAAAQTLKTAPSSPKNQSTPSSFAAAQSPPNQDEISYSYIQPTLSQSVLGEILHFNPSSLALYTSPSPKMNLKEFITSGLVDIKSSRQVLRQLFEGLDQVKEIKTGEK